jgi:hypothetical protein
MRLSRIARFILATAAVVTMSAPATATTLVRQSVERLARENALAVTGRVVDLHSYWNEDHSFIFTDVTLRTTSVLKGRQAAGDVTVTLMGGTVGEITTLVIGGPELAPGSEYLMFLNDEELPGGVTRTTVRDLVQGVFEVTRVNGRATARSMAIGHPLLPDADGLTDPAGGYTGVALEALEAQIRNVRND